MQEDSNNDYKVVTEKTFAIPLAAAIAILSSTVIAAVSATVWLMGTVNDIRTAVRQIQIDNSACWTVNRQREFGHRFNAANPALKFPDTDDIAKVIR